jgi:hypothetical protein
VTIFEGGAEGSRLAAEQAVDGLAKQPFGSGKDNPEDDGNNEGVQRERLGLCDFACAYRARDRRCDATADATVRHHLHQHEDGKHQADAGQGLRPQEADEIGLRHPDKRLHDQHHDGRQREHQERRQHRAGEHRHLLDFRRLMSRR